MEIRRGVIRSFDAGAWTATVQIEGSPSYLVGVPVNKGLSAGAIVAGANCAVLLFDGNHLTDGMVIGVY